MKTKLEVNQHVDTGAWSVRLMLELGKDHSVVLTSGSDPDIKVAASWCLFNFVNAVKITDRLLREFGAEDTPAMLETLKTMSPAVFGGVSLKVRVAACSEPRCKTHGRCAFLHSCISTAMAAPTTPRGEPVVAIPPKVKP